MNSSNVQARVRRRVTSTFWPVHHVGGVEAGNERQILEVRKTRPEILKAALLRSSKWGSFEIDSALGAGWFRMSPVRFGHRVEVEALHSQDKHNRTAGITDRRGIFHCNSSREYTEPSDRIAGVRLWHSRCNCGRAADSLKNGRAVGTRRKGSRPKRLPQSSASDSPLPLPPKQLRL